MLYIPIFFGNGFSLISSISGLFDFIFLSRASYWLMMLFLSLITIKLISSCNSWSCCSSSVVCIISSRWCLKMQMYSPYWLSKLKLECARWSAISTSRSWQKLSNLLNNFRYNIIHLMIDRTCTNSKSVVLSWIYTWSKGMLKNGSAITLLQNLAWFLFSCSLKRSKSFFIWSSERDVDKPRIFLGTFISADDIMHQRQQCRPL